MSFSANAVERMDTEVLLKQLDEAKACAASTLEGLENPRAGESEPAAALAALNAYEGKVR